MVISECPTTGFAAYYWVLLYREIVSEESELHVSHDVLIKQLEAEAIAEVP